MIDFGVLALVFGVTLFAFLAFQRVYASDLKSDEHVILFTTNAHLIDNGRLWQADVHGWIFEPEEGSAWRSALANSFVKRLGLDKSALEESAFRKRAAMFLVDNERNKRLTIDVAGESTQLAKSGSNGHFFSTIRFPADLIDQNCDGCREVAIVSPAGDERRFAGRVQLIGEDGISVISDIDDTVKTSDVLNKRELIKNTFLRPFEAVPGMPQAYQRWADQGAVFHYVSSSPWQLYPFLTEFLDDTGLPGGSLHLKQFRVKDQSFFDLFASSMTTKVPTISRLVKQYPKRRFVLVGDSGEHDPEVYAEIYRQHPDQVAHIFIRNVTGESADAARYQATFGAIPAAVWTVFDDPNDLGDYRLPES